MNAEIGCQKGLGFELAGRIANQKPADRCRPNVAVIPHRGSSGDLDGAVRRATGMDRNELMLSLLDLSGIGLEIGPGYNPLVPKASGRRIEILDYATAAELRERYGGDANVDISRIEDVDYVSDGRPLAEVINKPGRYDYIVASHVIEHAPDMLGFLKDCEWLLKPEGVLVLAVPDKRLCFDVLQPLTSTGMVLQAHVERRTRPVPGQLFDHLAYVALRGGSAGWNLEAEGPLTFAHELAFAHHKFKEAISPTTYVDAHAWRFTPSSFRLILSDLYDIGELRLRERFFSECDELEFHVSLARRGSGCPFDRLMLARMAIVEQQEITVGPMLPAPIPAAKPAAAASAAPAVPDLRGDGGLLIVVNRGGHDFEIEPAEFETFLFEHGDQLCVVPADRAALLPVTWGDTNLKIEDGRAVRVPSRMEFFEFKGFQIPAHLINLTGAGPDTLDALGRQHIERYREFVGLRSDMTIVDLGCGIGRDALQLVDVLDKNGRYVGIDVTRDSIVWCQQNITPRHPNFTFHHFDAHNELYNPHGTRTSMELQLPVDDESVDRVLLSSVFTHLLPAEVLHYMKEFRRVLKPSGLVYAMFFLWSEEAIAAAQTRGNTPWRATFAHPLGGGAYANDPAYPRGAVAFADSAMRQMIDAAGLRLVRPFLKGWWSGLHEEPEDAQDVAILARAADSAAAAGASATESAIRPPSYDGLIEQRSTRHVAGWMVNLADPLEQPEFEVVVADQNSEIVVAHGLADHDTRWLWSAPAYTSAHGFHVVLPRSVPEAEREWLIVRPIGGKRPIANAAHQQVRYLPIRHVALDVVDNCNLRCPFCVYDYSDTRRTNLMSETTFDAAIRLMPYVGNGHFWLSCLHEPTMHPRFASFIERIPWEHRSNVFYTTNLSRRMPQEYYDTIGRSGLDFINVSLESRDPAIYERMRKGARYRTFMQNWEQLLAACRSGSAPPALRYIIMAYKSNLNEIPHLVAYLREERNAATVGIRYTFDMEHISPEFKQAEFLSRDEWQWLQSELAQYPAHEVNLSLPRVLDDPEQSGAGSPTIVPGEFEFRISYDGTLCISPIYSSNRPDVVPDLAETNIMDVCDPVELILSLDSKRSSSVVEE